jgi:uncharacterized protein DUF1707
VTPTEPGASRAGDADREAVAEQLRVAADDGRIDLAELDERLGLAYAAKTFRDLDVLVADLSQQGLSEGPTGAGPEPETLALTTRMQNIKQAGQWIVPQQITAETTAGSITIDFTEARSAHREITVEATCGSGGVRLILPSGWAARIGPSSTNTSHIRNRAAESADVFAPTVIVTGHPRSGYIKIRQRRAGG